METVRGVRILRWLFPVVVFFVFNGFCLSASAASYYVSPTGKNTNPGTSPAKPWKTITAVNSHSFVAGDHIFFQGESVFAGSMELGADDLGAPDNPIVISSYGIGKATINAGTGRGLTIYNVGGIEVENLLIIGAGRSAGNTESGIFIYTDLPAATKLNHVYVRDCEVSGFGAAGITIGSWPNDQSKSGFRDVRLTNVIAHDNADAGITSWGYFSNAASGWAHENIYVGHCITYDNKGIADKGIHSGSGIVLSDVIGATIERCVSYNNGQNSNYSGGGPVGIWAWDANQVTIQFNESYNNKTATIDGGGFDFDGGVTNSVMQYNYSHDNAGYGYLFYQFGGARPFYGNIVRYNISQNDGRQANQAGILAGGGVSNTDIYNNVIFMSPPGNGSTPATVRIAGANNFRFFNNIFIATGGLALLDVGSQQPGLIFQGNNYWSGGGSVVIGWMGTTYISLTGWRSATGQERLNNQDVGLSIDPMLESSGNGVTIGNADALDTLFAYRLKAGSPMVNAGLNLTTSPFNLQVGTQDFYGNPLPQGLSFDIGTNEVDTAAPLPPNAVTAIADNAKITLAWSSSGSSQYYSVKRSDVSGGPYQTIATNIISTSYTDLAVVTGTTYYYVVSATNQYGESPNSSEVSVSLLLTPTSPDNLTATAVSPGQINLAWQDHADNEDGFTIERSLDGGNFIVIATVGQNVTSFSDLNLSRNQTYYYRVRCFNSNGYSDYSNIARATTLKR